MVLSSGSGAGGGAGVQLGVGPAGIGYGAGSYGMTPAALDTFRRRVCDGVGARGVAEADAAVNELFELRRRVTDQLASLSGHLDHIRGLASRHPATMQLVDERLGASVNARAQADLLQKRDQALIATRVVVSEHFAQSIINQLAEDRIRSWVIGEVRPGEPGVEWV